MKKERMKTLTIQLPPEVFEKVTAIATQEYTSNSSVARRIIINHFKEKQKS